MNWQLPHLSPRKDRTARRAPARGRLTVEALEDRVTPSRVFAIGDTLPLVASALTPTNSGFTVRLSRPLDPTLLNLYGQQSGTLGPPDVTVTGPGGPVSGSVVLNATNTGFTFLATGGVLAPGTYTVTFRSAADGFKDTAGVLLDGNGDFITGDNYTTTFVVAAPAGVVVGVPDVMRGPGQALNVPATGTGLPLRLSNGAGVTSVRLTLRYDPRLLTVTAAAVGDGVPAGATVALDVSTPGAAVLTFTSPTALGAGAVDFVRLTAVVPDNAPYTFKHVLDLVGVRVNDGAIAATDDDGLHVVGYLGDVNGNAAYTAADATRALRAALGLDSGFPAFPLADPLVIGDVTANGQLNATDATRLLQESIGIDQDVIPPLPGVIPMIPATGPDPLLNLPTHFRARPGATVTVPVNLDVSDGLETADIVISYDTRRLVVRRVADVRRGSLTGDFNVFGVNLDAPAGTIRVGLGRTAGAIGGRGSGSVIEVTFRVLPTAPPGRAIVNLRESVGPTRTQLNDGGLDLNPDPSDDAGDALDGAVRVVGNGPQVPLRFLPLQPPAGGDAVLTNLLHWLQECPPEPEPPDETRPPGPTPLDEFFLWLTGGGEELEDDDGANTDLIFEYNWDWLWVWLDERGLVEVSCPA